MRLNTKLFLISVLFACTPDVGIGPDHGLLYAAELSTVTVTEADSSRVKAVKVQTDSLRAETCRGGVLQPNGTCSGRKQTPRTSVVVRLANRVDSLEQAALRQQPPVVDYSQPAPDTASPPPPQTGAIAAILQLVGPTLSVQQTASIGFARYDSLFQQYLPAPSTDTWDNNYYDRAVAFYARFARTGDSTFLRRGHSIAVAYRKNYLEPNNYGSSAHWSQVRGLEIHYRLTGDTLSRRAVVGIFARALVGFTMPIWGPKADLENTQSDYMENRIQARVLQAALSSYRMGASLVDGSYGEVTVASWPTRLRTILNQILSVQNADGSYSWVQICGGQLNYMVGMLNDVLIEYYRDFEADPRIPAAITAANEYLWTTQWLAADQAFKYASVHCSPNPFGTSVGGTEPAGDLNGLLVASFGWLSNRTQDPKWRARGDAIMAGLMLQRWAGAYAYSKQFNQAFAEAYRYFGWR